MTHLVTVRKDNGALAEVSREFAERRGLKVLDAAEIAEAEALRAQSIAFGGPAAESSDELVELTEGVRVTPPQEPPADLAGQHDPDGPPAPDDQHTGGQL